MHPQNVLHIPHKNNIVMPDYLWGVINNNLEPIFQFPILMARSFMSFINSSFNTYKYAVQLGSGSVVIYRWVNFNEDLETFNTGFTANTNSPVTFHEDSTHLYINVMTINNEHNVLSVDKTNLNIVNLAYSNNTDPLVSTYTIFQSKKHPLSIYKYTPSNDLSEIEMDTSNPLIVSISETTFGTGLPKIAVDFNGSELIISKSSDSQYTIYRRDNINLHPSMLTISTNQSAPLKSFGVLELGNNELLLVDSNHSSNAANSIIVDVSTNTFSLNIDPLLVTTKLDILRPALHNIVQLDGDNNEIYAVCLLSWPYSQFEKMSAGLFKWNVNTLELDLVAQAFAPAVYPNAFTYYNITTSESEGFVAPNLTQIRLY